MLSSCMILVNRKAKKMGYEGYFDKHGEWVSTPSYIKPSLYQDSVFQASFNEIPLNILSPYEAEMDSTLFAQHCFKFIHNKDTSKFLALFLVMSEDDLYDNRSPHMRTVRSYGITKDIFSIADEDTLDCGGYPVWGIKINGVWNYWRDNYYSCYTFNAHSPAHARQFVEGYILNKDTYFFKYFLTENQNEFWETGGRHGQFEATDSIMTLAGQHEPATVIERNYRRLQER